MLSSSFSPLMAQQDATAPAVPAAVQNDTTGQPGLPQAPEPNHPGPLFLRSTGVDYTKPKSHIPNPIAPYTPMSYPAPRLTNTPRLNDLLRDGKLYLSLNDAITLALENNYDIAIARINLDIADTDLLRARAGSTLRGISTGIVSNTLGGQTATITGGGGPGGTTTSNGGSGTGSSGLVLSTNGAGPLPEALDPYLSGTLQYESSTTPQSTSFIYGTDKLKQNTGTFDFAYKQGFITGTELSVGFNNTRQTTNGIRSSYSPILQSTFQARVQQHLLQGFGWGVNGRFIVQAKNNRRITDSGFRQQVIYTVTQVESIYWALVSAYEDVQARTRALQQSTQLAEDNRKQLQIGTLAPLDVVTSDNAVATDQQALVTSQSNLEYQQLLMKQAIARNLNDPQLSAAPVVPTDRVDLARLPEEDQSEENLVRLAYTNNPQIEQAKLNIENSKITQKALKNGLLPTVDAYGFYGSSAVGGAQNPGLSCGTDTAGNNIPCPPGTVSSVGYGSVFQNLFNNSAPDKGVGVQINIPIRNRTAQADQARSQMEFQQTQMRLQQLYTQIRMQVINYQFALKNDRAAVQAAQISRDYQAQSLEAEQKRYKLGASTSTNVLQQERNLSTAENTLSSATAAYARDRAQLLQVIGNTLDRYGITLADAASGTVTQKPLVPGLTLPKPPAPPKPLTQDPGPLPSIVTVPPADQTPATTTDTVQPQQ
ncbi:MAG: TolC family protein [Acidobacteria bacterium]|nr:TolC family protein [Acidobacteriota bacterium]